MARAARIVVRGVPHHLTQRGNNRQDVFFVDEDRKTYLRFLAQQSRRHGAAILGYCLMTNHVHLIVIPRKTDALAKAIGRTHWLYAQYVNRLHRRSGHLWQSRFYSNPLDEPHCLLAMRYVERNPIRAGLCRIARRYPWSSAAIHCGEKDKAGLLEGSRWTDLSKGLEWEAELAVDLPKEDCRRIRTHAQTGRPLATDFWLSKLERRLGHRLRALPIGRPKKKGKPT
jgi:REP-associated tyrosine transposase